MKRSLLTIVIAAALTIGVVWLFNPGPPPQKMAEAPKPAAAPKPATPAAQVAAPVVAPVKPQAPAPAVASAAKPGDAQSELNTAFSDIINLVQSGDFYTAFERYVPPDVQAQISEEEKAQLKQEMASDPPPPEELQMFVGVIQTMQGQSPALNDAGDRATYQVSDPTGRSTQTQAIVFKKIDGKWYVDPQSMGMRM